MRWLSAVLGHFPHQLIAYQANASRGDKFSDARIRKDVELGLAGFLEAGAGAFEFRVGITRVAHQFG